jgi:hypothetical protein
MLTNLIEEVVMRTILAVAAVAGVTLLAGCGSNEPERAQGGAATGAATGAAIGITGGPPGVWMGGLMGGAAGATTGAVTSPRDVNLGPPPWGDEQ